MAEPTQSVAAHFFDDLTVGAQFTSPGFTFTEAGIIDFAWQFDPQPFHTDVEHAREHSIYGGLIASGYHTLSVCFRLVHATGLFAGTNNTGRNLDEVRFLKPVYAGDDVIALTRVENLRRVRSLRCYQFRRQGDDVLLAKGETDWVFVNIATGRPQAVAEDIIQKWHDEHDRQ